MPGLYAKGDFDLAGFAVGAVERGHVLPRTSRDARGRRRDRRRVVGRAFQRLFAGAQASVEQSGTRLCRAIAVLRNQTLGEALIAPTRLYVKSALAAIRSGHVHGLAHITGGGITENLPRCLPDGLDAEIDLETWVPPAVFGWLSR